MDFVNQNYLISCQCLNSVIKHALGYYMHLKMCWPRSHSPGASRQFIVDGSQLQATEKSRGYVDSPPGVAVPPPWTQLMPVLLRFHPMVLRLRDGS